MKVGMVGPQSRDVKQNHELAIQIYLTGSEDLLPNRIKLETRFGPAPRLVTASPGAPSSSSASPPPDRLPNRIKFRVRLARLAIASLCKKMVEIK